MRSRRWLLAVGAVGVVAAASAGTIMAANAGETPDGRAAATNAADVQTAKAADQGKSSSLTGEVTCTAAPYYPYIAMTPQPGVDNWIVPMVTDEMRVTCTAPIQHMTVRMYNEQLIQGEPSKVNQMWSGSYEFSGELTRDTQPLIVGTYSNGPDDCDQQTNYQLRYEIYYTWPDGTVTEDFRTISANLGPCSTWPKPGPPAPPPGPPAPGPGQPVPPGPGPGPGQPFPPGPGQPLPPKPF